MACSILIVEDEFAIAELIRINLKHEGYTTLIAKDALQAENITCPSLLASFQLYTRAGLRH